MNDIYRVSNLFFFIKIVSDSFFLRKMGGEFWEGCSYFGTELSVVLFIIVSSSIFLKFYWAILMLGME